MDMLRKIDDTHYTLRLSSEILSEHWPIELNIKQLEKLLDAQVYAEGNILNRVYYITFYKPNMRYYIRNIRKKIRQFKRWYSKMRTWRI